VILEVSCFIASRMNRASFLVCSSFSAMSKAEREEEEQWEYPDISLTEKTSTSRYDCLIEVSLDRQSTREGSRFI
jgi:hypothetical protein